MLVPPGQKRILVTTPVFSGEWQMPEKARCWQWEMSGRFLKLKSLSSGLTNPTLSVSMQLYPNPAGDFLMIKSDVSIEKIALLDVTGKLSWYIILMPCIKRENAE